MTSSFCLDLRLRLVDSQSRTVALSSIVIIISLALAFSTWARTVIAVVFHLLYVYATYWLRTKAKTFQSTMRLRELERNTIKELEYKALTRRLRERDASIAAKDKETPETRRGSLGLALRRGSTLKSPLERIAEQV